MPSIGIVEAQVPGTDAMLFLLVKVKPYIHPVVGRHPVIVPLAVIFILVLITVVRMG